MSRLLIVGPKRILTPVVDELQKIGALHVDHIEAADAPELSSIAAQDYRAERETIEKLRVRIEAVLGLLPPIRDEMLPPTQTLSTASVEELEKEISRLESLVQPLVRARLNARDELELLDAYESAVRVLAPLLGALAGSANFETVGFLLRTKDLSLVQDFRNKLNELTGGRVEVVSRVVEEGKIGVVVAFHRRDAEAVRAFLARAGVSELRLPSAYAAMPPAEAIKVMSARRSELPSEVGRIDAELQSLAQTERSRALALRAVLIDRLARLEVIPQFGQSRYAFIVHGWAPTRAVPRLREVVSRRFGQEVVVYDSPADPHEAERVPVLLDNPRPIRPFQLLLGIFAPPQYGTFDPSPLIAVTFPLFVGLVIGDAGYGALFFLLGWMMRNRARAGKPLTISMFNLRLEPQMLEAVSWLVRVVAFWVIIFGVIYAEVFGNLPELFFHVHPIFNRVEEQDLYFRIIIGFGVFMIYLGLFGHLFMAIVHRHFEGILESGVLIFGSAALLVFVGVQAGLLPAMIAPWSAYLAVAALATLIVAFATRRWMSAMWVLESFTVFGHILSHARLMAFGLAAAALATAANQVGPEMQRLFGIPGIIGTIFATLIAALFQALFFIFTILGHLIQPARLHWVELLTKLKYYEHSGRRYSPFQRSVDEHQRA